MTVGFIGAFSYVATKRVDLRNEMSDAALAALYGERRVYFASQECTDCGATIMICDDETGEVLFAITQTNVERVHAHEKPKLTVIKGGKDDV